MLGQKRVNERNHLEIGSCDVVDLAEQFGTPLYVFDEDEIRSAVREYKEAFSASYPRFHVAYAGKAFLCAAMCSLVAEEGLWLDVVSGGEYFVARESGFPEDRVIFHGNNKTDAERSLAFQGGVGRWVVDSFEELECLLEEGKRYARGRIPVLFRITPGIDPHTHAYIATGKIDSKFGFPISDGIAEKAITLALSSPYLDVRGIHCHIGSQIRTLEPFLKAVDVLLDFMASLREKHGVVLDELDLGGGLGVPYLDEEKGSFPSIHSYVTALCEKVREKCASLSYPLPLLFVEPGRSIVNTAGSTLYRVGFIKEIPGVKKYVAVDGGMVDNPRPVLYGARYQAIVGNRVEGTPKERVAIAGKCCESGDVLIPEIELPRIQRGDILVIEGTGAYNYSMASNYNLIPRPGVVFVRKGVARLVVRPESLSDLLRRDLVPCGEGEKR
ncbi:MAG: diaminopimelate decarboxylase [Candidatus Caldatribacterium sp.]|nr:diaminopimelate decarboxylase [Candidatus Caldatribacterium sp.]